MDAKDTADLKAQMPSPLMKNLPHIIKIAGLSIIAGCGFWYKTIADDPAFTETFGDTQKILSILGTVTGFLTTLIGTPVAMSVQKTTEDVAVKAKEETSEVKKEAAVEVKIAEAAPPVAPEGVDEVSHILNTALGRATQLRRFSDAQKILTLVTSMTVSDAPAKKGGVQ